MKLVIFNVTYHHQNLTEMYNMVSPSGLQGYLYNFYYIFSYHLPLKKTSSYIQMTNKVFAIYLFQSHSNEQIPPYLPPEKAHMPNFQTAAFCS